MLTVLLLCAMCASHCVSAVSLRQIHPFDSEEAWRVTPQLEESSLTDLPISKMTTRAIELAAADLSGYYVQRNGTDLSCEIWDTVTFQPLNTCFRGSSDAEYLRITASSTTRGNMTYFSDSKCATVPIRSHPIPFGVCKKGFVNAYSTTNAPQTTRPYVKLA
jgi:hypothetical protein